MGDITQPNRKSMHPVTHTVRTWWDLNEIGLKKRKQIETQSNMY